MIPLDVFDEFIDFFAGYERERIINYHPSAKTQKRIEKLSFKKQQKALSKKEKKELDDFLMLEHIIRLAKAKALKSLAA